MSDNENFDVTPHSNASKIIAFLYSSIVYLGVWVLLIYVVGFVGNYFGPALETEWRDVLPLKSIDMGKAEPFVIAFLINTGLMIMLGLQHSIMPRKFYKRFITRFIPVHLERSTYIVCAIAAFSLLMWQWRPIEGTVWRIDDPIIGAIINAIGLAGWLIVLIATFQVGHWGIFGVAQSLDYIQDKPYTFDKSPCLSQAYFKSGWPVAYTRLWNLSRHPDFLGFIVAFWFTSHMTVGHLMFAIGLTLYIMIGIFLLERNFVEVYGRNYELYIAGRSKILPWFPPAKPEVNTSCPHKSTRDV